MGFACNSACNLHFLIKVIIWLLEIWISDANHYLEKKISPNCILEFIHSSSSSLSLGQIRPPVTFVIVPPTDRTPSVEIPGSISGLWHPGVLSPPPGHPKFTASCPLAASHHQLVQTRDYHFLHPPTRPQQTIKEIQFYTSILTIFKNIITISFVCITQL